MPNVPKDSNLFLALLIQFVAGFREKNSKMWQAAVNGEIPGMESAALIEKVLFSAEKDARTEDEHSVGGIGA